MYIYVHVHIAFIDEFLSYYIMLSNETYIDGQLILMFNHQNMFGFPYLYVVSNIYQRMVTIHVHVHLPIHQYISK